MENSCVNIIHQNFTFDIKVLHCGIQADATHELHLETIERHVLNYVIEGSAYLIMNNKQHKLKKGDLFWVPRDTPYSFINNPKKPCKYFYLAFNGNQCLMFLTRAGFSLDFPVVSPENPSFFYEHLEQIYSCLAHNTFYTTFQSINLFSEIFLELFKPQACNHTKFDFNLQALVDEAQQYIYSHYHLKISAYDVCNYLHISYSYFAPIFKESAGFSLNTFIANCRMEKACYLLAHTRLPIAQISEQIGFDDYANFYRQFSSKLNISPQKYRIQQKLSTNQINNSKTKQKN